jgi:CDP-diacylglycerol pyrophosphatase
MKLTDYLYASVPSFCLAVPFAQLLPDLAFLQGIEKLGIVGIMAAGFLFFVRERRSLIAKSGERLEMVEKRLGVLETKVSTGNDKVIHLLGEQLEALKEIKNGQAENFSRMWQLTLRSLNGHDNSAHRLQEDEDDVLQPEEHTEQG